MHIPLVPLLLIALPIGVVCCIILRDTIYPRKLPTPANLELPSLPLVLHDSLELNVVLGLAIPIILGVTVFFDLNLSTFFTAQGLKAAILAALILLMVGAVSLQWSRAHPFCTLTEDGVKIRNLLFISWKEISAIDAFYRSPSFGPYGGRPSGWFITLALHDAAWYATQLGFWRGRIYMTFNDQIQFRARLHTDNYRTTPSLLLAWMQSYHRRYGA